MLNMTKPQRALVSVALLVVSFAIAYALRHQVPTIWWPTLGILIAFSLLVVRTAWIAARHGPRALFPR